MRHKKNTPLRIVHTRKKRD